MTASWMSSTFVSVHATATHPPRAAAARMKRALPPSFTAGANAPPRRTWATTPFPVREAITAVPSSATAVVAPVPSTRTARPATSANDLRSRLNTITSPPAATVSAVRAGGSAGTSTSPHALGASAARASRETLPARRRRDQTSPRSRRQNELNVSRSTTGGLGHLSGAGHAPIEGARLFGDRAPGEVIHGALTPGAAHRAGLLRIGQQRVRALGEVGRESLAEGDEEPGPAVDDDLGDAADLGRHHGGLARHRLEVDDPERLVDRRAREHRRVAEQLDHLAFGEHLLEPDHAAAGGLQVGDAALDLGAQLGRVRRARAQHELGFGQERARRLQQVLDALLAR